jgi:hypothetical protein
MRKSGTRTCRPYPKSRSGVKQLSGGHFRQSGAHTVRHTDHERKNQRMRRLGSLALLCFSLLALLSAGVFLTAALAAPLRSDHRLFAVQDLAERARSSLLFDSTSRAEYRLSLLERRLSDLAEAADTPGELPALARASASLDAASLAVARAPESRPGTLLRARLARMADRAAHVQASLTFVRTKDPAAYDRFRVKLATLRAMTADPSLPQAAFGRVAGIVIPFAEEAVRRAAYVPPARNEPFELRHGMFPLEGAHATMACAGCHTEQPVQPDQGSGGTGSTVRACAACHRPGEAPDHPAGSCTACHSTLAWTDVRFNHRIGAVPRCQDCHLGDKPSFHSRDDCASCHNADSWSGLRFDHPAVGLVNCQGCHAASRPPAHAEGQCSTCHPSTADWQTVSAGLAAGTGADSSNRSALEDSTAEDYPAPEARPQPNGFQHPTGSSLNCQGCHASARPAGHYAGQCSQCHTAGTTWKSVNFNHQGRVDCQGCHATIKPANHYAGQCSQCHSAGTTWQPVSFNHQGRVNCQSCHAAAQPANHYPGQCSQCHSPGKAWKLASFDHGGAADCLSCHAAVRPANHYPGQCSACHDPGAGWGPVRFNHDLAGPNADCLACHASRRPANHYPGQCSACHAPGAGWRPVRFDHGVAGTGADCQGCHGSRRPANHYPGQCSACHDPSAGWRPVRFDHGVAGTGADCQGCHEDRRPANHFQGQCSACHDTDGWTPANFNHDTAGSDCQGCHEAQRPGGHSGGQCSSCHNTDGWIPANFNHDAGGADCQGCHEERRPDDHFQGQCSECHTAGSSWGTSTVNHTFPINHRGANGACTTCHPAATPDWSCFSCHDQGGLEGKHSGEGISEIAGRCLNCHPTGEGGDD